jgi:hypothetical protein
MASDLNDAVNSLFRGIVFIFYDYFASLGRLVVTPISGSMLLVKRLWSKRPYQTQPYVFLFISFFVSQAVPRYLSQIINFYRADFPGSSESTTAIQAAYTTAIGVFDAKPMLAITLACLLMSVLVDGLITACLALIFRRTFDRAVIKPVLLYISGAQAVLLTAAIVGVFLYFKGWAWDSLEGYKQADFWPTYQSLVNAVTELEHGWDRWRSLSVLALGFMVGLYALILPALPITFFATKKRLIGWRRRLPWFVIGIAAACIFAPATIAYYEAGSWVEDRIAPTKPEEPIVSEVTCFLSNVPAEVLRGVAVISNPSDTPLLVRPFDVEFVVVGDRDTSAPQTPSKSFGLRRKATKYVFSEMKANITNSGQGTDKPAYLVAPGQSLWIELTAARTILPKGTVEGSLHCGVSLPNFSPAPIRAFGNIIDADTAKN